MIHCDVCQIDFKDGEVLAKTSGFMCQCTSNICVPCMTIMCLGDTTFIAGDEDGLVAEKDEDYVVQCPFCRKALLPFFKKLFEHGYIYQMMLCIKMYKHLGQLEAVEQLREAYRKTLGLECPF